LLANRASNVATSSPQSPEPGEPGVVDQDVNVTGRFDQALQVGGIAQVGSDKARPATRAVIDSTVSRRGRRRGMDDDLGAVAGQLDGNRTADAGRSRRHESFCPGGRGIGSRPLLPSESCG